jgi:hypothetical protein
MTNQEANRVYWSLPECYQDALNVCLLYGHTRTAAEMLRNLADTFRFPEGVPSICEAMDWAKWRRSLRPYAERKSDDRREELQ